VLGALIGAAQGYWVAYFKIPSFIVTLAGSWYSRGGACRAARPVGRPVLADIPETLIRLHSGTVSRCRHALPTSLLIGAMLALGLVYVGVKTRARRASHGVEIEPTGFFVLKNVILFGVVIYFTYLHRLASRPAQCAGDHDRADRALRLRHHAHHNWPADLCGRRQ